MVEAFTDLKGEVGVEDGKPGDRREGQAEARFRMLAPLKIKDFALLWAGLTVSLLGDGIFFVALPLQVFALRNDASSYTWVLMAWTIPLVLLLIPGGLLSDRFDRRRLLVLSNTLQGVAVAILGVLVVMDALTFSHLVVAAVVYGSAEALFGPAFGALVPEIVPENLLVEANALDNFSRPFSLRVAGPAVGGMVIAVFGLGPAFLIDAMTFAIANAALLLMRPRASEKRRRLVLAEIAEGFRFVTGQRWLWGTLLATALGLLAFYGPWQALVPYVVVHKLDAPGSLGTVLAVGGIGSLLAAMVVGQRNLPRRSITLMYVTTSVGTLMLAGFGLADRLSHAIVASFLMQGLFTAGIIVWNTTMHRHVPGDILGRVSSVDWLVSTSLVPISLALTGPLSQRFGEATTLIAAGVAGFAVFLSFLFVPGVRDPERSRIPVETRG
jgi:MFS family permease